MVKQIVRRPRPVALLQGTRHRGREAAGRGYLSGHGAVAIVLGAAALPLDIAGGAALGLAVEAAVRLAGSSCR